MLVAFPAVPSRAAVFTRVTLVHHKEAHGPKSRRPPPRVSTRPASDPEAPWLRPGLPDSGESTPSPLQPGGAHTGRCAPTGLQKVQAARGKPRPLLILSLAQLHGTQVQNSSGQALLPRGAAMRPGSKAPQGGCACPWVKPMGQTPGTSQSASSSANGIRSWSLAAQTTGHRDKGVVA